MLEEGRSSALAYLSSNCRSLDICRYFVTTPSTPAFCSNPPPAPRTRNSFVVSATSAISSGPSRGVARESL
jgi:hypothetical protein